MRLTACMCRLSMARKSSPATIPNSTNPVSRRMDRYVFSVPLQPGWRAQRLDFRSHPLQSPHESLPGGNFALIDMRHDYMVTPAMDGKSARHWSGCTKYCLTRTLRIHRDQTPLQMAGATGSSGQVCPNSDFLGKPETKALLAQRNFSIAACIVIMVLALGSWRSLVRRRLAELAEWAGSVRGDARRPADLRWQYDHHLEWPLHVHDRLQRRRAGRKMSGGCRHRPGSAVQFVRGARTISRPGLQRLQAKTSRSRSLPGR